MAEKHFHEQLLFSRSYLIPFLQRHVPHFNSAQLLEVGCAEGGLLSALHEAGVRGVGLEISASRAETARVKNPGIAIFEGDITDPRIVATINQSFDIIVLRDVIEHIADRESAIVHCAQLLKREGFLYITFPPRYSPYAGHQQNGTSLLRYVPYLHLLPAKAIRFLGAAFRERPSLIQNIVLNHHIGLSCSSFRKLYQAHDLMPIIEELFIVRPIYRIRFGLTPRKLPDVPIVREILATSCECLLQRRGTKCEVEEYG